MAELLTELTEPSRWERLRGRDPAWRVLHSVPLGDGQGRVRGDVDHVLIGPPGVVTINTKHRRGGRLELDGDALVVNWRPTQYVRKARREAERVTEFLAPALAAAAGPAPGAVRAQEGVVGRDVVGGEREALPEGAADDRPVVGVLDSRPGGRCR